MGCGGIPNTENTWVLQGGSSPSLQLEDVPVQEQLCLGMQHVLGASLHPVLPRGDGPVQSGPTDVPLSSILHCHPQGHIPVCRPCGWRDNPVTDRQQVGDAPGLCPSSMDFGELFSCCCVCGTEGGTPVTLPSLPALPPAACPRATSPSVFVINRDW